MKENQLRQIMHCIQIMKHFPRYEDAVLIKLKTIKQHTYVEEISEHFLRSSRPNEQLKLGLCWIF